MSNSSDFKKMPAGNYLLGLAAACLLGACSSPLKKPDAEATTGVRIAATPNAAPQRTITNFTESLRCMDDKLAQYEISGLLIGAQEVYNHAAEVTGTKDMLLTSLSTMSRKSKAFGIVALSDDLNDVSKYFNLHGNQAFKSPDFFIRIGSPQIDKGVQTDQVGGGIGLSGVAEVQSSKDRIASVVSIDMNLGTVRNLQLLPGIYSSNSIAVVRKGSATDLSGEIEKLGAIFRVTNDNSEGFYHSVRTLIELGTIEIVGRLTQIPYWECLDIQSTNPAVQAQVQDWFAGLSQEEKVLFVQSKLTALEYYTGDVDGVDSAPFRTAIAKFKADNGLIADGEIDFLLYYNLVIDSTAVAPQHLALLKREEASGGLAKIKESAGTVLASVGDKSEVESVDPTTVPTAIADERLVPLALTLTAGGGENGTYKVGESVELQVSVTSDAHVYCYYQQGDGGVVKIFPNRFRPYSVIAANEPLDIPGAGRFQIKTDRAGQQERVMCMASYEDIDKNLPAELRDNDLQPLPVKSLEQVHGFYRGASSILPVRSSVELTVVR